MSVRIVGQDILVRAIQKMESPDQLFDGDFLRSAIGSVRRLVTTTPRDTGNTARGWTVPRKIGASSYFVGNSITTIDRKHLIAKLLNDGRGEVRPIKARRLYIPLTNKGKSKRTGAKIPKGLVFGVDYVLALKSRATKPTKFIDNEATIGGRDLTRAIIQTIRKTNGQ